MKLILPRIAKFVAAATLLFATSLGARAAETLRYLFLVDHSPEMATRQLATVQVIYNSIRSGFQNEIHPDEKFAIWFYGSRLQTNAPFTWQPGHETEIARAAANLFTGRIYSRMRPREQTLADAAPFIAAAPKITVFIITDGSQPLAGTPFDTAINATLDSHHFAMQRVDKPFVITLMARYGKWVDGNIFASPNDAFEIPELDRRNELMEKALAAVRNSSTQTAPQNSDGNELDKARAALRDALSGKTAAPAPPVASSPSPPKEPPTVPPEAKANEQVQKKEEPKAESPQAVAQTATPPPAPLIDRTPPPLLARPVEQLAPVQEQPKPAVREEPKAVVQKPTPAPPVQEQPKPPVEEPKPIVREQPKTIVQEEPKPVVQESKPPAEEKPKHVAQVPVQQAGPTTTPQPVKPNEPAKPVVKEPAPQSAQQKSSPPPQQPNPNASVQTAAITPQKKFPLPIFVGGLLAIAVGGAIAFRGALRRSRSPGSIITQALPRTDSGKKSK
jgi:hypothetical protein